MAAKFHTIEPENDGTFSVFEHGKYHRSSVLAGQARRTGVGFFQTLDLAQAAYPKAEVLDHTSRIEGYNAGDTMGDLPPSWFNPNDAGESW